MRKSVVIVTAAGILGLVGVLVHHQLGATKASADGEPVTSTKVGQAPSTEGVEAPLHTDTPSDAAAQGENVGVADRDYESDLRASKDIWQFAESVHPAAKAGEPAAQYYLSRALKYCDTEYRFYFVRGNKRRTLDEAMQWASTRVGLKADDARATLEKCGRLQESSHPFGTANEWLSASKENKFDLAMIDSALQLALKAGVSGATEHVEMRDEAKRLALEALKSKDPEVIFDMGDLAGLFVGDMQKASQEQWVWRLAACKRGYECGQNAEWYQHQCRFDTNCQPYESGVDFIRRANSEDFEEIDRLSNELNAKLDADDFNWFGS